MRNVIIIFGPTGVGKSEVAIECAKRINGEIISADSMQIYKELNIGTAKVTKKNMQNIPHHLINIRNFNEKYNAFNFVTDCKNIMKDILSRNKIPIIVGGTNLYITALIKNYDFKNGQNDETEYNYNIFCLNLSREIIYDKINKRVDKMLQDGLLDEVKNLKNQGLTIQTQAGKSIGYKELLEYLDGKTTLDFAIEKIKQHSRNYAKRQLTWLRSLKDLKWLDATNKEWVINYITNKIMS